MNARSYDAALAGNEAMPTLLARITAWFAAHNCKALASTWADGTRGF